LKSLEAPVDVGTRERKHVADVQPFGGGIRKHHEVVERPLGTVEVRLVGVPLGPARLPLCFD
jgi:hypothetical protein